MMRGAGIALVLLLCSVLCGANSRDTVVFQRIRVVPELVSPPRLNYVGGSGIPDGKAAHRNVWLLLKIEYVPILERRIAGQKVPYVKGEGPLWADRVTMTVRAVFDTERAAVRVPGVLFTGKTVFWSIRLDGVKHQTLAVIPGVLLERYLTGRAKGEDRPGKNLPRVEVSFLQDGRLLGRGWFGMSGKERLQMHEFEDLVKRVPGDLVIENAVLPRHRSPWGILNPDRFDLEMQ